MIEAIAVSDSLLEFVEWTVDGSLFSSSILDAVTGGDFLFRSPTGVVVLSLGGGSSVFSLTSEGEASCLDALLWVLSIFLLMFFAAGENATLFLMIGGSMIDSALSFKLVGGDDELDRFLFLLVVVASVSMVMGCDSSDFDLVVVVVVVVVLVLVLVVVESGERPSIFAIWTVFSSFSVMSRDVVERSAAAKVFFLATAAVSTAAAVIVVSTGCNVLAEDVGSVFSLPQPLEEATTTGLDALLCSLSVFLAFFEEDTTPPPPQQFLSLFGFL